MSSRKENKSSRRSWVQVSIRGILFGITVICVAFALLVSHFRTKERCLARLRCLAAEVSYDYQWADNNTYIPDKSPPGNLLLKALLGEHYAAQPREIRVVGDRRASRGRFTDDDAALLCSLSEVRWLVLQDTDITDDGLHSLAALKKLERLDVEGSRASPHGIWRLKAILSHTKIFTDFAECDENGQQ